MSNLILDDIYQLYLQDRVTVCYPESNHISRVYLQSDDFGPQLVENDRESFKELVKNPQNKFIFSPSFVPQTVFLNHRIEYNLPLILPLAFGENSGVLYSLYISYDSNKIPDVFSSYDFRKVDYSVDDEEPKLGEIYCRFGDSKAYKLIKLYNVELQLIRINSSMIPFDNNWFKVYEELCCLAPNMKNHEFWL